MAQYFDDIQVSDKGMIKLIKEDGRNYIFPAGKIKNIYCYNKEKKLDDYEVIINLVKTIINMFKGKEVEKIEEPKYLYLETKEDEFYVSALLTEKLVNKIEKARRYSNRVYKERYGTFS